MQPVTIPSVQPIGLPTVQSVGLPNVQSFGIPVAEPISEDIGPSNVSRYPGTNSESNSSASSPPVPPRKKSADKIKFSNKENLFVDKSKNGSESIKVSGFFRTLFFHGIYVVDFWVIYSFTYVNKK